MTSNNKTEITLANTGKKPIFGVTNTTFNNSKKSLRNLCKIINQRPLNDVLNGAYGLTKELDTCLIAKILTWGSLIETAAKGTPLYKYQRISNSGSKYKFTIQNKLCGLFTIISWENYWKRGTMAR